MKKYTVIGMSCAACQARVERAVNEVAGVTSCAVNLLTGSMGVEGDYDEGALTSAVKAAGYGIEEMSGGSTVSNAEASPPRHPPTPWLGALLHRRENTTDTAALADRETPVLLRRLVSSLVFLCLLMYLSMGHTMWGLPLPAVLAHNPLAQGLLQMLLALICMCIGKKFFVNGAKSIFHRAPNMDALVALGSTTAFLWSVFELFVIAKLQTAGDLAAAHGMLHSLYFESAAMILSLITLGKLLEARAKGKTTTALRSLMSLAPQTARVLRGDGEVVLPIEDVQIGDIFRVLPGESIPCDGVVLSGESAVNESALTGEALPLDKKEGDFVSAATTNGHGVLRCRVTRIGEDSTLSKIIALVSDAAATKAPIAKIADRVSGIFVPVVMAIALLVCAVWLMLGESVGFALARGISVLVISCPCALGLATPVAVMVGSGVGAKNGILFKSAASLEGAGRVDTVVLDKTGTVTEGKPVVTDIIAAIEEALFLSFAVSIEADSEHPLAIAIRKKAEEQGISPTPITHFRVLPGNGVTGVDTEGIPLWGGSMTAFADAYPALVTEEITSTAAALAGEGKTPLLFVRGDKYLGMIAVADKIKDDSPHAIRALHALGLSVILLTGDNERTANAVGKTAGVDRVIAGVLPDGKAAAVKQLTEDGHRVMMVGDGINDAPALATASVGCAIGAGTDVAIESSDIVLMGSRLSDVVTAIRLGRAVLRNIGENLFWAFGYNLVGIPLAAGAFIPLLGWELSPMFGAAAMSISSFLVVSNALRLNTFKPTATKKEDVRDTVAPPTAKANKKQKKKERLPMTKTLKIEGMMCPRCEAHVTKALLAVDGVIEAHANHETGQATVTLSHDVNDATLAAAVEAEDYRVL